MMLILLQRHKIQSNEGVGVDCHHMKGVIYQRPTIQRTLKGQTRVSEAFSGFQ